MSSLTGRFTISPNEKRRGVMDYTAQLATGETIVTPVTVNITPLNGAPLSPPLVVNGVVIGPGNLQVVFFVSGGVDGNSYEAQFLALTSVGQEFDDVVQFDVRAKT